MGNRIFPESRYLVFSCRRRIDYGQQITILVTPTPLNGKWVTFALDSKSQLTEIYLNSNEINERNYIVMQHPASRGEFISHHAISVNQLEEVSQRIENEVIQLLHALE
jgi:hypothetical protein